MGWGVVNAAYDLMGAKAWKHRAMWEAAAGSTIEDISKKVHRPEKVVRSFLNTADAQAQVLEMMNVEGRQRIERILHSEVIPSLRTIVEIRDNRKAPASTRLNACVEILDRLYGKARQAVEVSDGDKDLRAIPDDELMKLAGVRPVTEVVASPPAPAALPEPERFVLDGAERTQMLKDDGQQALWRLMNMIPLEP